MLCRTISSELYGVKKRDVPQPCRWAGPRIPLTFNHRVIGCVAADRRLSCLPRSMAPAWHHEPIAMNDASWERLQESTYWWAVIYSPHTTIRHTEYIKHNFQEHYLWNDRFIQEFHILLLSVVVRRRQSCCNSAWMGENMKGWIIKLSPYTHSSATSLTLIVHYSEYNVPNQLQSALKYCIDLARFNMFALNCVACPSIQTAYHVSSYGREGSTDCA